MKTMPVKTDKAKLEALTTRTLHDWGNVSEFFYQKSQTEPLTWDEQEIQQKADDIARLANRCLQVLLNGPRGY